MIDMLISGLAEILAVALETMVSIVLPVFGFSFNAFNDAFPFARTAYTIFQSIALGIVLLLAAAQIIPFFFGYRQNKTTPIRAALFAILAVFGIYYGNYIMTAIMEIAQMPYNAILNSDIGYGSLESVIEINSMMSVVYDACYQQSIVIYIVLLLMIGIAFIKLLLEAVERYVILFVLIYTTPLAASTLASENTSGIFKKFFTMFISQCILLILNVWSLQMITSLFSNMGTATNPMITLLIGYAFLRIASRLDSYLNALGLNAAVTGAGLGVELMATGMMLMSSGSSFKGGKASAGGSGILGFSKSVGGAIGKINPISGGADAAKNFMVGGVGKTAKSSMEAFRQAATSTESGKFKAGARAFGTQWKSSFAQNKHDAWMKTQDQNLLMRNIGQTGGGLSGHDKSLNETLETMFSNGTLSNQELNDIANTSFAANGAFNSIPEEAEINDSAAVAATMQGIGLSSSMPEAEEAIQVGLGNIDADNTAYSMTAEGAQMSYSINGKGHTWDVRNSAQMQSLSLQEQSAYTRFKSDGHTYYAKHLNQNDRVDAMFSKMQKNNTSMPLTDTNKDQFTDFINSTRWNGISPATQKEITTAVQGGGSNISGGVDSRRFWIETEKGYGVSIFSSGGLTDSDITQDTHGNPLYDRATLEDRGYTYNKVNGKEYWVKECTDVPADREYNDHLFNEY